MRAGIRNTKVILQRPISTRDSEYNEPVTTWHSVLPAVFAEMQDSIPSRGERLAEGIVIANQPARVRMLYREDVQADWRLKVKRGNTYHYYKIVGGPAMLGFNEGIEMMVEKSSVETTETEPEFPGS